MEVEDPPGEGGRHAARMGLRSFRDWACPARVDGVDEEGVPAVEQLWAECIERVQLLMRRQDVAAVPWLCEQDSTPVVDELRDVDGPVDLGDFTEDRAEEFVEGHFSGERDDEVMDLGAGVEVSPAADSNPLRDRRHATSRVASMPASR